MIFLPRGLLILPVLALTSCATPLLHPTQLSVPGPGKSFAQFRQDDALCQAAALGATAAVGDNMQGRFDAGYAQCMVGHGETIEPPSGPADLAARPVIDAPVSPGRD